MEGRTVPVVAHLDVCAFYASVEQARLYPSLEGLPVAVRQRQLLVTTNYVARDRGVPKMCSVEEAKKICPDLVVIESDMARYREGHRRLFELLRTEFGLAPEKASIDEAYLDLTELVKKEMSLAYCGPETVVFGALKQELDLEDPDDVLIAKGGVVANRIRMAIRDKLRLETAVGVSRNKSFAKYASSLNKPSLTTLVPISSHEELLRTLSPQDINGFGPALVESVVEICHERLDSFHPEKLIDLQRLHQPELDARLGAQQASWIYQLCRGVDLRPVRDKGAPSSFGFQAAHRTRLFSMQELYGVILKKAEEMAARLEEDEALYDRVCRTLTVSFRFEQKTVTRSRGMPARGENRALEICAAAMDILSKHQKKDPAVLSSPRFGLTASGFSPEGSGVTETSISQFLSADAPKPDFNRLGVSNGPPPRPREALGIEKFLTKDKDAMFSEEIRTKRSRSADLEDEPQGDEEDSNGDARRLVSSRGKATITAFLGEAKPRSDDICPVCGLHIDGNLRVHVNRHFDVAEKPPPPKGIGKFFTIQKN